MLTDSSSNVGKSLWLTMFHLVFSHSRWRTTLALRQQLLFPYSSFSNDISLLFFVSAIRTDIRLLGSYFSFALYVKFQQVAIVALVSKQDMCNTYRYYVVFISGSDTKLVCC